MCLPTIGNIGIEFTLDEARSDDHDRIDVVLLGNPYHDRNDLVGSAYGPTHARCAAATGTTAHATLADDVAHEFFPFLHRLLIRFFEALEEFADALDDALGQFLDKDVLVLPTADVL